MGKQPGCMWGLAHVLGYHHWQSSNARKQIQHHKYGRRRNDRCDWSPRTHLYVHDDSQAEKLLEANQNTHLINERSKETQKQLLKTRIKSTIAEEMPEEIKNKEVKKVSVKRNLQRNYSIHHLESMEVDWKNSIIFLPSDMKNFATQSIEEAKTKATSAQEANTGRSNDNTTKDVAEYDSKENPDVLEMFMVDKGLLTKHLQEADECIDNFSHGALGLTPRAKLSKSRSFPLVEWSGQRKCKPVKLESKHKEVCSGPRKDIFQAGNQALRLDHSSSFGTTSGELAGIVDGKTTFSGVTMDREDLQVSNEFVMPSEMRSDIMKTFLAKSTREIPNILVISESLDGIANGQKCKNIVGERGKKLEEEYNMRKYVHRKSSSLNEALDKYIWLFENSFLRDVKLNSSKSLKLANEYAYPPEYAQSKLSLSNDDFHHSTSKIEEFSCCASKNGSMALEKDMGSSQQNVDEQNMVATSGGKNGQHRNIIENCDKEPNDRCNSIQIKEDGACLTMTTRDVDCETTGNREEHELKKSHLLEELDTNYTDDVCEDIPHQGSIFNSSFCLQERQPHAIKHQTSEGLGHTSNIDGLKFSVGSNDLKRVHSNSLSKLNLKNDEVFVKIISTFLPNGYPEKDDADLFYVKYLLNQANLRVDASKMPWHAFDQSFSMELFKKGEACWPHKKNQLTRLPDFYGCWHHQMLFDSVNEIILEVYDASFPYYPKVLSSCCHVRPFALKHHIIEEVSTIISMLLNLRKQSLDGVITHDLSQDKSWMNLQMETECVALELEDAIFNELLEEITRS